MSIKNNGHLAAFASSELSGLTKREYFASMAMQGFLAASENRHALAGAAQFAVRAADELLEALESEQTEKKQ